MNENQSTNTVISQSERDEIAGNYMPLVKKIAAKVSRKAPPSVTFDDLVSAGMLGLVDAASRYDPERADQFKYYAEARVRGAMIDELRSHGPLSRDLRLKSSELSKTICRLETRLGYQPDQTEIADEMGISLDRYHTLLVQLQHATILSPTVIDQAMDNPRGFPERIVGNPQDDYLFSELREQLAESISKLSAREQKVLSMYYKDEISLKEIGEIFDVTESRICQIRAEAVHRLRAMLSEEYHG